MNFSDIIDDLEWPDERVYQSARDKNKDFRGIPMLRVNSEKEAFVPLRNVSIEAWIDTFAADVTLMQTFVNLEDNPIEVVYVFPIEVLLWTLNAYSQMFIADTTNFEKTICRYPSCAINYFYYDKTMLA